jgi:hypothetical protein
MAAALGEWAAAKPAARAGAFPTAHGRDVKDSAVTAAAVERSTEADKVAVEAVALRLTGARVITAHLASAVMAAEKAQAAALPRRVVVAAVAIMAAAAAGLAAPMIAAAVPVAVVVAAAHPTPSGRPRTCVSGKGGKIEPVTA